MGKAFETSAGGGDTEYGYTLEKVTVSSYSVSGSSSSAKPAELGLSTEVEVQKGLLLPAVQEVREPSPLPPDQVEDQFDFTAPVEKQEVGLLLPAVQAAREDAADPLPTEDFTLSYEKVEFAPVDDGFIWM